MGSSAELSDENLPFCCRLGAVTSDLELLERLMQERRSERQFSPDEVAPAVIDRLLAAAALAPSASNRQPYRFMAVTRRQTIDRMVRVVQQVLERREQLDHSPIRDELKGYSRNFLVFGQAPVVVVVFFRANDFLRKVAVPACEDDEVGQAREALSSAAAAIMQLLLVAHATGLGACWMTGPCMAERELLALLEAPPGLRIAALVPMGYCIARSAAPQRRQTKQLRLTEPMVVDAAEGGAGGDSETAQR